MAGGHDVIGRIVDLSARLTMMTRMEEESKAWREDLKTILDENGKAWREDMKVGSEEIIQSVGEHQVVPRKDAVVKPVRGRKKRHRARKQAAGRRGQPKDFTRGESGSRKKLAAACRMASRRATVAWRKKNFFRKSWTNGNCGPRKKVTASRKKATRCARHRRKVQNKEKVAQRGVR
jgi:hypothetical protein